jgi:hypothetical protein
MQTIKCVVVGDGAVGKVRKPFSLLNRVVFVSTFVKTIERRLHHDSLQHSV